MKLLVVAHGAGEKEKRTAFDFINSIVGSASFLFADGTDHLVNFDRIEKTLAEVDGLILIQCAASSRPNGPEESELQRVERLALTVAIEAKKTVGVIGTLKTLMSKHLNKCADGIGFVGIFQSSRDGSGAVADHFKAKPVYMSDMDRGAREFMKTFMPPLKEAKEEAA